MSEKNKTKIKILPIVLILVLLTLGGAAAYLIMSLRLPFAPYPDGYRIDEKITLMKELKLVDDTDAEIQFTNRPTVVQAAVAIVRALGMESEALKTAENAQYGPYISFLVNNKYLKPSGGETAAPDAKITAKEFMTIVLRALGFDNPKSSFTLNGSLTAAEGYCVISQAKLHFLAGYQFTEAAMYDILFEMLRSYPYGSSVRIIDLYAKDGVVSFDGKVAFYDFLDSIYTMKYSDSLTVRFRRTPDAFPDASYNPWKNDYENELGEGDLNEPYALLKKAFDAYPPDFLKSNLSTVYVFKDMIFSNIAFGSVHLSPINAIYTADSKDLDRKIHHELSGILFEKYASFFSAADFTKENPAGFSYSGSGPEAIASGKASTEFDPSLYGSGFLYGFAQADMMADFMSFAENLMMNKAIFWDAVAANPKLKYKADYVIGFYHAVDASFTEEFFKALPKQ